MQFEKEEDLYSYEVKREGGEDVLYINYMGAPYVPSISEYPEIMERTIDSLIENSNVSRIVFVQQKNYNYDFKETSYLLEIAQIYVYFLKQEKILSQEKLITSNPELFPKRYNEVFSFLYLLKKDPFAAYFQLRKIILEGKVILDKIGIVFKSDQKNYLSLLEKVLDIFSKTKLIQAFQQYSVDYRRGDREIYNKFFRPDVIANFTFTRLVSDLPEDAEIISQYKISNGEYDESWVTIMKRKNESKLFYHIVPPENTLSEEQNSLLNMARGVLIEHQPKAEEFTDTERIRQVFMNISKDLIRDLAQNKGVKLDFSSLNKLAAILVRHTIGFGVVEVLLQDKNLQDISLNAPIPQTSIFVRHQEYDECITNILPSQEDADSWAAKFRMISGRPLDEANPILDTQLEIGNLRARISIVQQPLSCDGLAYSIRRHRESPWTLPLFVNNKMINPFAAGLLSFLVDGARTLLVAGTRSSGKCVDGNTLIQLSDGNIKKIKDLVGEKKQDIEDGIIFSPNERYHVKSLNYMDIKDNKISDVWKRESPEKVIKIKTKSGKEIITTKEHPYFIYNRGLKDKRADELNQGDLIASPRNLNMSGKIININLKNHPCLIEESEDFYILKGKTSSSIVKFPKKVTPELAEFVGLLIGDGHLDETKIEFYNNCKELRERYISLLEMFGVKYRVFKSRNTLATQVSCRILSRLLNEVFEIPFGNKANKVIIPSSILKSDNEVLSRFIRGYFDTDGYIPRDKRDMELATASKLMSEQLQLALLRFGITSFNKTRKIKGQNYYRILVRGEFIKNFAKHIGFIHPFKKERLNSIVSKTFLENSNVDVIPQGNEIVKELRLQMRASPKQHRECGKDYWAYENNEYRVSRNWFRKIISFYKRRYGEIYFLKDQIDSLRKFANFDLKNYLGRLEVLRKFAGVSYASLASQIGMSEGGVRKSLLLQRTNDLNSLLKISKSVEVLTGKNLSQQARSSINELSYENVVINSVFTGIILSNLRNALNISNEELSQDISIGSVSNFFSGVSSPSFRVLQSIAKKVVDIFDSAVSEEVIELLLESEKLANSDIFWDEIVSADLIDKVDDYVYDLTVEYTHNFVANGLIAHNTSLLGSLMLEIVPKHRIIVIEDTLELPVESLRKLNYDILRMKVRSALLKTTTEISADDGIRTSLRLGDSCLIIGEVRSVEAKALYEAMRVGALANVVAGTIHGASPYGVFDRVVNDLEVPVTSFKATDSIIVCNPIKSPDGLHAWKRLVQISEVRKHWTKDPMAEKGFVDLMKYNIEKDEIEPTEDLINGDSEIIKDVASNVRGWAGNWDAVYDNILLRAKIKKETVDISKKIGDSDLLECKFNALSNHIFHRISDEVIQEIGLPLGERVFPLWQDWLNKEVKKRVL